MTSASFRPPVIVPDEREVEWGSARLIAAASRIPTPLAILLVLLGSSGLGLLLGFLGTAGSPILVVVVPATVILVALALRQPVIAVAAVPLSIAAGDHSVANGLLPLVQATALLACGVVVLTRLNRGVGPLPFPPPAWWAIGLVLQMLLSTSRAPELQVAVRRDASVIVGLLLALAVVGACRRIGDVRRLVAVALAAGGAVCALGLALSGTVSASAGATNVSGSKGLFTEHNQAGSFAAAVLLLAIGAGLGARTARGRWAAGAVGALALLQVGLSLSRGAWVGCITGFLALLVLQRRARRALVRLAPPLLLALVVAATLTPAASELQIVGQRFTSIGSADKNPYDDRTTIWGEALREFRDSPLLGQGPGAFPYVSSRLASRARTVSALHAHDVPLHVAAELGGPGLVLIFGFTLSLGFAALRASRRLNEVDGSLAAGVGAALATFAGQGLFDVTLLSALIATMLWFLIGLVLALSVTRGEPEPVTAEPVGPVSPGPNRGRADR